jgi:hypothetical protein
MPSAENGKLREKSINRLLTATGVMNSGRLKSICIYLPHFDEINFTFILITKSDRGTFQDDGY